MSSETVNRRTYNTMAKENGQNDNVLQNTIQQTKDRATRTPIKSGG